MDGKRFDTLVRGIGKTTSRRAAVAGMLAAAFGASGIGRASAKRGQHDRADVDTAACNNQGCLAGGVLCLSGFGVDGACGSGGNACFACGGTTPRCAPDTSFSGGSCQAALPCNDSQCQLAGACVSMTDSRVCGRFANGTCQQGCSAGQVCTLGAGAVFPLPVAGTCTVNTCSASCSTGCCTGLTCNTGNQSFACGVGGGTCTNCFEVCGSTNNGCGVDPSDNVRKCQCQFAPPVDTCGPANCPNGCCLNGQCQTGTAKEACGTGGATCAACVGKKKCSASTRVCKKRK